MRNIGVSMLLAVVLAACAQVSTVVYYNSHWNDRVNLHMVQCLQREATIPLAEKCMLHLGIYI